MTYVIKDAMTIIDPCFYCGQSTAPGYGRWVNRIGYVEDDFDGWACAGCAGYICEFCDEGIYLDEDRRWNDTYAHVHEECLSKEQNQIITMFNELGGEWELPYDHAEAWFTDVIKIVMGK